MDQCGHRLCAALYVYVVSVENVRGSDVPWNDIEVYLLASLVVAFTRYGNGGGFTLLVHIFVVTVFNGVILAFHKLHVGIPVAGNDHFGLYTAAGINGFVASCASVVEELGRRLGFALANIACVVDPEIFVIGGGVSRAGAILIDTVKKYFQQYAFHACKNTEFEVAKLGNDAGMYGGACSVLE